MNVPSIIAQSTSSSPPDNTVAIVAVAVAGVVGLVGPLITAWTTSRRSERELAAATKRQERAIVAERERLDAQLAAERDRLQATLSAERHQAHFDVRRGLLDEAVVLLNLFRGAIGGLDPTQDRTDRSARFNAVTDEMARVRARMTLWFGETTSVLVHYDAAVHATVRHWIKALQVVEQAGGDRSVELTHPEIRGLEEALEEARTRFLDSASDFIAADERTAA